MPLSLRLDPELEARIVAFCEQTGMSKSKVISLGVKDFLDAHGVPSLYELAEDLLPAAGEPVRRGSELRRTAYRDYVKRKHGRRTGAR